MQTCLKSTSINNQTNHRHNHHRRTYIKLSPRPKWHNAPLTTMKKPKETKKMNEWAHYYKKFYLKGSKKHLRVFYNFFYVGCTSNMPGAPSNARLCLSLTQVFHVFYMLLAYAWISESMLEYVFLVWAKGRFLLGSYSQRLLFTSSLDLIFLSHCILDQFDEV